MASANRFSSSRPSDRRVRIDKQQLTVAANQFRVSKDIPILLDKYLAIDSANRNAHRALLQWTSKFEKEKFLQQVITSFKMQCTRRSCFSDIEDFVKQLNNDEEVVFLESIDAVAKSQSPWANGEAEDINMVERTSPAVALVHSRLILDRARPPTG